MSRVRIAARRGVMAVAAAGCVALPGLGAAAPAAGSVSGGSGGPAVSGARLWASRYSGPADGGDGAGSVAVSPGGGTVFVTGRSVACGAGSDSSYGYATVAYNAATGARLWVSRYDAPNGCGGVNSASSEAVSPGGGMVFVTGSAAGTQSGQDYVTVAYDAVTGAQRWVSRYDGPRSPSDNAAHAVAVSPGGGAVYVTGRSLGSNLGEQYATVAYDAATGAQLWVSRYNGPTGFGNFAYSVAVSPGGGAVFVTGESMGSGDKYSDYATVAYDAATGAQLWVSRYHVSRTSSASSVTVSPGGRRVYITGHSYGRVSNSFDYATVAYDAATGARLWVRRYNGPGNGDDQATAVKFSPGGLRVFVTGGSVGSGSGQDYATVAYDAATGARLWVSRYNGPGNKGDGAASVAVGAHGRRVYVTGASSGAGSQLDYATVAYNAATGARLWVRRYNSPGNGDDYASSVAVSPDTGTVFVTGSSYGGSYYDYDYLTIAYKG